MINANQVVPVDACIDELWQSQPPNSAISTLQTYVLQIRRRLRASTVDDREVLATHNRSYQLHVPEEEFDRAAFESLVHRARAATTSADDELAASLFDAALGLWRGPALADIPAGPASSVYRLELEEIRFGVQEQRIESCLRLGRHDEVLGELQSLAEDHSLHENLHAQLMLALYRSGRREHAIAQFHGLRQRLLDQLGLDPVPRMQRLHEAIVAGDPMLEVDY
jgi:DNA-binding SARP family transcriptional activator